MFLHYTLQKRPAVFPDPPMREYFCMKKNVKIEKRYDSGVDALRTISILAVLLIHTTTRTIGTAHNDLALVPWSLFLNQISRFAVPLFFLISGFVLELSYPFHANYFVFLKRRFARILIPYIAWSAIYYYFVYTQHSLSFFQSLPSGNASYQLYFIPSLLVFYLLFPLIHLFVRVIGKPWVMVLLFLVQAAILFRAYFIAPLPYYYPISIAILNFYVFVFGAFASHSIETIVAIVQKFWGYFILLVVGLGSLVAYEGYSRYLKTLDYNAFYSQWRPSVLAYTIVLSAVLYVFLRKVHMKATFIKAISSLTFFVFFVHVIVLENVWRWFYPSVNALEGGRAVYQAWFDPVFFFMVAGISFGVAFIAHKIPFLSKLTG